MKQTIFHSAWGRNTSPMSKRNPCNCISSCRNEERNQVRWFSPWPFHMQLWLCPSCKATHEFQICNSGLFVALVETIPNTLLSLGAVIRHTRAQASGTWHELSRSWLFVSQQNLCGNGKKNWCQKKKETVPPYKEGLRMLQYLQYYHILQASNGSHLSRTLPSLENSHDFKFSQCKARSSIFSQPSQPALPTREVWRTKKNAKWLNGTNSTVHPYILSPRISIPFHIKYSTRLWLNGWTCEDSCH